MNSQEKRETNLVEVLDFSIGNSWANEGPGILAASRHVDDP